MTQESEVRSIEAICEVLIKDGLPGMRECLERLMNFAMQMERDHFLRAKPYERTPERQGYANGFKERDLATRMGAVELKIPQVRVFQGRLATIRETNKYLDFWVCLCVDTGGECNP